jgi:hypothetical protein
MTNGIPTGVRRFVKRQLWQLGIPVRFSARREGEIIAGLVAGIPVRSRTCIDLGAGDGVTMSNTYPMFMKGWNGVAVECDDGKARTLARVLRSCRGVQVHARKVAPHDIAPFLRACGVERQPGLLSLDLDSYDAFVLDALLEEFRPELICCEINEKVPPPLRFAVRYSPEFVWDGGHCYGMSIALLADLCARHRYHLIELHYNNAFLVPSEISSGAGLSANEAYDTGYKSRTDRLREFPWNADVDNVLTLSSAMATAFFLERFEQYRDHFYLSDAPVGDAFWKQQGRG